MLPVFPFPAVAGGPPLTRSVLLYTSSKRCSGIPRGTERRQEDCAARASSAGMTNQENWFLARIRTREVVDRRAELIHGFADDAGDRFYLVDSAADLT